MTALVVFLTSGYGFGGARRRKALRELLEIRRALPPETALAAGAVSTTSRAEQIDALVDLEIKALAALGDPQKRWFKAAGWTVVALATAAAAAWTSIFYVPDDLENVFRYIAASAVLLIALIMAAMVPPVLSKVPWWGVLVVTFVALFVVFVLLGLSAALIDGTPYSEMLLNK